MSFSTGPEAVTGLDRRSDLTIRLQFRNTLLAGASQWLEPWGGKLQTSFLNQVYRSFEGNAMAKIKKRSHDSGMNKIQPLKDRRIEDPIRDRRSGNDRRHGLDLGYFTQGGIEKRSGEECRQKKERRDQYFRIDKWSSIWVIPKSDVE
jgi:hypothetical protein